jgi:hypothetical protein
MIHKKTNDPNDLQKGNNPNDIQKGNDPNAPAKKPEDPKEIQ